MKGVVTHCIEENVCCTKGSTHTFELLKILSPHKASIVHKAPLFCRQTEALMSLSLVYIALTNCYSLHLQTEIAPF